MLLWAFAALAAAALTIPFVGWIIAGAAAMGIALAVAAIVLLSREIYRLSIRYHDLGEQITELRPQFQAAVASVNANCCPSCIVVDLREPC